MISDDEPFKAGLFITFIDGEFLVFWKHGIPEKEVASDSEVKGKGQGPLIPLPSPCDLHVIAGGQCQLYMSHCPKITISLDIVSKMYIQVPWIHTPT